jgi:hypothetical protein
VVQRGQHGLAGDHQQREECEQPQQGTHRGQSWHTGTGIAR